MAWRRSARRRHGVGSSRVRNIGGSGMAAWRKAYQLMAKSWHRGLKWRRRKSAMAASGIGGGENSWLAGENENNLAAASAKQASA